jgi:hypothetical protein
MDDRHKAGHDDKGRVQTGTDARPAHRTPPRGHPSVVRSWNQCWAWV